MPEQRSSSQPVSHLERPRLVRVRRRRAAARDRRRAGAALPGARTSPASRCRGTRTTHTEQVMFILEGEVEMTVEDETTTLGPGDVGVVNRGLHHKLYSERGVTFMEALAPVPLDHVPDRQLDLVLGPDGGATHVEA